MSESSFGGGPTATPRTPPTWRLVTTVRTPTRHGADRAANDAADAGYGWYLHW